MPKLEEFIVDLNGKFSEMIGGSFCKMDTGEIFTKTEVQKYVQEKLKKFNEIQFKEANKEVYDSFGVMSEQTLRKTRKPPKQSRAKTKQEFDNGNFNMVYRCMFEEVYNMKLDNNEKLVYFVLRDFISYPTNSILFNGKVMSFLDLECIVGLKERSIRKAVKSLEEKGLFKLKQAGHKKEIFVNPMYYASGRELDIDTLKMFGILECDDEKVESYLHDDKEEMKKTRQPITNTYELEYVDIENDEFNISMDEILDMLND